MARYRNRGAVAAGAALQNLARILADFGLQNRRQEQQQTRDAEMFERQKELQRLASEAAAERAGIERQYKVVGDFLSASPREQVQQFSVMPEQWMATALEAGGRVPLDNQIAGDPSEVGIAYADPTTGQVTPSQINSPKQAAPSVFDAPGSPFEGRKPWERARALDEAMSQRGISNAVSRQAPTPEELRARSAEERAAAAAGYAGQRFEWDAQDRAAEAAGGGQTAMGESQRMAAGLYEPLPQLQQEMAALEDKGVNVGTAMSAGQWMNPALSSDQQTYRSGMTALVQNISFAISGKQATQAEVEQRMRALAPAFGDSTETILAKRRLRQQLIDTVAVMAGRKPAAVVPPGTIETAQQFIDATSSGGSGVDLGDGFFLDIQR